jgi:hypothetical protein
VGYGQLVQLLLMRGPVTQARQQLRRVQDAGWAGGRVCLCWKMHTLRGGAALNKSYETCWRRV